MQDLTAAVEALWSEDLINLGGFALVAGGFIVLTRWLITSFDRKQNEIATSIDNFRDKQSESMALSNATLMQIKVQQDAAAHELRDLRIDMNKILKDQKRKGDT